MALNIQKQMSSWGLVTFPRPWSLECNMGTLSSSSCFLLFPRRTPQLHLWGIIGIMDYPFQKKVILFGFMRRKLCAHAHWPGGLGPCVPPPGRYRTLYSYFYCWKKNGQAVQAVKRCEECLLSFLPRYSIFCWVVPSRWMHFRKCSKSMDWYRERIFFPTSIPAMTALMNSPANLPFPTLPVDSRTIVNQAFFLWYT